MDWRRLRTNKRIIFGAAGIAASAMIGTGLNENLWPSANLPFWHDYNRAVEAIQAIEERAYASGKYWLYDNFGALNGEYSPDFSTNRLSQFYDRGNLVLIKSFLIDMAEAEVFFDKDFHDQNNPLNDYFSNLTNASLSSFPYIYYPQSFVGSPPEQYTTLSELTGAPSNYLEKTPFFGLSTSEYGWKYITNMIAELCVTAVGCGWKNIAIDDVWTGTNITEESIGPSDIYSAIPSPSQTNFLEITPSMLPSVYGWSASKDFADGEYTYTWEGDRSISAGKPIAAVGGFVNPNTHYVTNVFGAFASGYPTNFPANNALAYFYGRIGVPQGGVIANGDASACGYTVFDFWEYDTPYYLIGTNFIVDQSINYEFLNTIHADFQFEDLDEIISIPSPMWPNRPSFGDPDPCDFNGYDIEVPFPVSDELIQSILFSGHVDGIVIIDWRKAFQF